MLKNKTRILITHDIDILDKVDRVIVMKQGRIIHQGHFEELKHLEYFRVMQDNRREIEETKGNDDQNCTSKNKAFSKDQDSESTRSGCSQKGSKINNNENKEKIIVNWRSFYNFFSYSYLTIIAIIFVVIFLCLQRETNVQFDYYLIKWVKKISSTHRNDAEKLKKVLIYNGAYFASIIASKVMEVVFIFSITVSLFRNMIKRVMHAPINIYFDVTPSGVILNRFSKDFRTVEIDLTSCVIQQIGDLMSIIVTIILAAYSYIWILVIVPIVALSLLFCYMIYIKGK